MEATVGSIEPAVEVEAEATPTCPKCGSTSFARYPIGNIALRCDGCHDQFDATDLVGARFEFLKAEYLK